MIPETTVHPKKYAHGSYFLCFVVVLRCVILPIFFRVISKVRVNHMNAPMTVEGWSCWLINLSATVASGALLNLRSWKWMTVHLAIFFIWKHLHILLMWWTLQHLTHWVRNKMGVIFQTTFWNVFSWMKIYQFQLRCHWGLFLRPINNIPALVQIMAWHRPGNKPLPEPMMVRLPTHICVTRPQWVKFKCYWLIFRFPQTSICTIKRLSFHWYVHVFSSSLLENKFQIKAQRDCSIHFYLYL